MSKPTSQNRLLFKKYLQNNKEYFSDNIISCSFSDIKNVLLSYSNTLQDQDQLNLILFESTDFIDITDNLEVGTLYYIPGLPSDQISVGVGTTFYNLTFNNDDASLTYNSTSYGLNGSLTLGNKIFNIIGVGGALLSISDPPVYSVGVSTTTVNEGGSVNFTINTLNVGSGTTLYYSTGGSMEAADFSNNSLTGSFTIVGTGATTGVATVTRTIANDFNTEGNESFTFVVRTNSTSGTVVATSSTITVADVVPSYSITPSTTVVNEGSTVTFTVTTTGVPNATVLYWTTLETSGTISSSDFTDAALSGSFTVNSNTGTITRTLVSDRSTEGLDAFKIEVRRTSTSGTIVATSDNVVINDTSGNVGQNANGLTFGPVQVNRDNGNTALISDWYTICGLDNLPEGSKIALFIDNSGSMTTATVQASYNLLLSKLAAKNISIITVTNSDEDWITPFLTDLS